MVDMLLLENQEMFSFAFLPSCFSRAVPLPLLLLPANQHNINKKFIVCKALKQ